MATNLFFKKEESGLELTQLHESQFGSTIWTREDGQMGLHSFCPETSLLFQPHTYAEYTIAICLEGEITKSQLGHTEVIGRGEAIIGNHGVEHTSGYLARHGQRCEAVVLSADRRMLEQLAREFKLPQVDEATSPAFFGKVGNSVLYESARAMASEFRLRLPGHRLVVETLATRMLVETLRTWPRGKIEKLPADLSPRLPRRDFVRTHEFMRWCRKDNFRLQHLCRFIGSSEERLNRLFLASTRHTPASFYNRMLLERGQALLLDPQASVKEVSFQLGYKNCSHFIAAFRKEFAVTPQAYRKRGNSMKAGLQFG